MGCRCAERGVAIARAAVAIRRAQPKDVATEIRFVARSSVEDLGQVFKSKVAATKQRLMRR